MGLFQSGLDENQKPNCPNRCPNWWPKGHDHRVPSRPAYAPGPQQAPHPHPPPHTQPPPNNDAGGPCTPFRLAGSPHLHFRTKGPSSVGKGAVSGVSVYQRWPGTCRFDQVCSRMRRTRRHSAMHTPHDAHRGQSAYTNPVKIPMHTPRCMGIPQRIPLGRDRLRYTPHAPRGVDLQYPAWWPLDARAVFLDPGTTRPTEDASSASVVVLLVLCMVDPTTQSKGWGANQIEVHSDHGANTPWSALPGDP